MPAGPSQRDAGSGMGDATSLSKALAILRLVATRNLRGIRSA